MFNIVEMFNPDTEGLHAPWQWLTGDRCGRHKTRIACWRKEAEKGKCFRSFIFPAVQAAPPSWPSLYYISTTNTPFKKVHPKHCSLYPHHSQSFSEVHEDPAVAICLKQPAVRSLSDGCAYQIQRERPDKVTLTDSPPHLPSAVNCNLTLDLSHLLRAVNAVPLTCSI